MIYVRVILSEAKDLIFLYLRDHYSAEILRFTAAAAQYKASCGKDHIAAITAAGTIMKGL